MFQACRRRKPDVKKVKRVDLRAFYFLRRLQKSGPTQGACCSTVYFPIVKENIFQTIEKHDYYRKVHSTACVGPHLGGCRRK